MGPIDERVFHKHIDLIAQQLLVVIPDNGIEVHRHTGVKGVIDQRVADSLYIGTIGTDMMIGVDLTINRVCFDIKSNHFQRIGMHKERVTL